MAGGEEIGIDNGSVDKTFYEDARKLEGLICLNCRTNNTKLKIISPHVIGYECKACGSILPYYAINRVPIKESIGRLEKIEALVGQPADEHAKPLFEIVDALNKEVLEIRLKIEGMEAKEKNYDYEVG